MCKIHHHKPPMLQPTSRECELGALGVFSASCRQLRRCTRCWTNSGCQRRAVHEEICFIWWWHISWHGSEATLWVCKKSFIEGSLRNVDKIQTKMKTVEEEKEVVELVENNHALVAELPSSQNSDHTILCAKKKVESKCSEETRRNTLHFLRFWLDCFWAERYRGPQRAYPCIIYLIGGIEQTCWLCKFVFFL